MKRVLLFAIVAVCAIAWAQQPHAQSPPSATRTVEVVHSKWDPKWGNFGISEQLFTTNHLSRLSADEVANLALAAYLTGWNDGINSVTAICGPQGKDVDLTTVKLYVSIPDTAPSEVASGIRNHLRSMPDVKIVYSPEDADVTIDMLALQNKSKSSGITLGYSLSYVANRPCIVPLGKRSVDTQFVISSMLETAGTVDEIVTAVSADLDSDVCERVRKWNETARKAAQQSTSQK